MSFDADSPIMRFVYPITAAIAGSISALSLRSLEGLTRGQLSLSIFTAFTFSYYTGPLAIALLLRWTTDTHIQGALYYVLASGANILIPKAIRSVSRIFGQDSAK